MAVTHRRAFVVGKESLLYASGDKKAISGKKMELKINRDICCRSAREYRDRQKDWQDGGIETYAEELRSQPAKTNIHLFGKLPRYIFPSLHFTFAFYQTK